MLTNPPSSSFEIMHPDRRTWHTLGARTPVSGIHPLIDADYTPYDVGVMGEIDVRILIALFGGREMADALVQLLE